MNQFLIIWPTYPQRKPLGSDCAHTHARTIMTQEIMHSSDAQCNTKESP